MAETPGVDRESAVVEDDEGMGAVVGRAAHVQSVGEIGSAAAGAAGLPGGGAAGSAVVAGEGMGAVVGGGGTGLQGGGAGGDVLRAPIAAAPFAASGIIGRGQSSTLELAAMLFQQSRSTAEMTQPEGAVGREPGGSCLVGGKPGEGKVSDEAKRGTEEDVAAVGVVGAEEVLQAVEEGDDGGKRKREMDEKELDERLHAEVEDARAYSHDFGVLFDEDAHKRKETDDLYLGRPIILPSGIEGGEGSECDDEPHVQGLEGGVEGRGESKRQRRMADGGGEKKIHGTTEPGWQRNKTLPWGSLFHTHTPLLPVLQQYMGFHQNGTMLRLCHDMFFASEKSVKAALLQNVFSILA